MCYYYELLKMTLKISKEDYDQGQHLYTFKNIIYFDFGSEDAPGCCAASSRIGGNPDAREPSLLAL